MKFKIENSKLEISPKNSGFSLVEALLAGSIFAVLVTIIIGAIIYGHETTSGGGNRSRALFIAEEGMEAIKNIKDAGFGNLTNGTHGLALSGNQWSLSGSQDVADIFTRTIQIAEVNSFTKDVKATISWKETETRNGSVFLVSRFTHWARTVGLWFNPVAQATLDLSGSIDGLKIQVLGNYAYIIRNDSNPDFLIINISNSASPSIVGSLNLNGSPTNIFVDGNYAYVSSRDNSQELQIINISNPAAPVLEGSFNAPGNSDGLGIYAVGTTLYLTRASGSDNEFVVLKVLVPAAPVMVGFLDLGAGGNEVYAAGNFAYVASTADAAELQVIDISIPAVPVIAGSFNLSGNTDALTLAGSGGTIFLGRAADISIFNASNPSSPSLISSFAGAGTINDIALNMGPGNYLYFVTANSNREFEVADVSNPASPVSVGSLNLAALNGIAYHAVLDRVFVVGESNSAEFMVIAPQ